MLEELDPQVKFLLGQLRASASQQPAPAYASSTEKIAAMRRRMRAFAAFGFPFEEVSKVSDLNISGPSGTFPVRLYVPNTADSFTTSAPVLIYYHGGGFVGGDLESHDTLLRALANRGRCLIASVAYRLAPENPYPAAHEDAWAALIWVLDHAFKIGANPRRCAVGGDSSGGLLAAWVAQKAKRNGLGLRLQLLLYPNLDATTSKPSWRELGTGSFLVKHEEMLERYDAYLPPGIDRQDPDVSPLFATDLAGVAPAFIVTADHDPLHDEGDEYAAHLRAANVAVNHICWPGMIHGFASLAGVLDAGKLVIDQIGRALREAFVETADE